VLEKNVFVKTCSQNPKGLLKYLQKANFWFRDLSFVMIVVR